MNILATAILKVNSCVDLFWLVFSFISYYHGSGVANSPSVAKLENRCSKPQPLKSWTQSITTSLSKDTLLIFLFPKL